MCGKKHLFYRCIFILFLLYIPLQVGYRVHLYLYFKFVSCYYCTELLTFVFVFTKKNCWFKSYINIKNCWFKSYINIKNCWFKYFVTYCSQHDHQIKIGQKKLKKIFSSTSSFDCFALTLFRAKGAGLC